MRRRILVPKISTHLTSLAAKIESLPAAINDTSFNVYGEKIGISIYNIVFQTNLENTNIIDARAKAIDAIDEDNNLFIQITSDGSFSKIKSTIEKFIESDYYKKSDKKDIKIQFLILGKKKRINPSQLIQLNELAPAIQFSKNDIIDFKDLTGRIGQLDIEKVERIARFLDSEFQLDINLKSKERRFICYACSIYNDEDFKMSIEILKKLIGASYDVILTSNRLYDYVKEHTLFESSVWMAKEDNDLSEVLIAIIDISDSYIIANEPEPRCLILKEVLSKNLNHYCISTKRRTYVSRYDFQLSERGERVSPENFEKIINNLLKRVQNNLIGTEYNIDDISKFLEEMHRYNMKSEIKWLETKEKSGYFLCEIESDRGLKFYYLFILGKTNEKQISKKFKKKYNNIPIEFLDILVQKENHKKKFLSKIKDWFQCTNVQYIGTWYFEKFLNGFQSPIYHTNLENYIDPIIYSDNTLYESSDVLRWVNDNNSDLAIIAGSGGMGKTTLSEYLYDELTSSVNQNLVLFIESKDLVEHFKNNEIKYDLYKIYKKWSEIKGIEDSNFIQKDIFITQLRVGNLIMIFDGLDEVISTCEEFVFEDFLLNVSEIIGTKQKSKVIINLRDTYLDSAKLENYLNVRYKIFSIDDFDEERIIEYFDKRFSEEKKKKNKAIKVCNNIVLTSQEGNKNKNIYPPYFLKIVGDIIEREGYDEIDDIMDRFPVEDRFFDRNEINDVIVNGFLFREKSKKEKGGGLGMSVQNQVSVFITMALSKGRTFTKETIINICQNLHLENPHSATERIWDHPLLKLSKGKDAVQFKYGFLSKYFISLGISDTLKVDERVSDDLLFNIENELTPNSLIAKFVKKRIHGDDPITLIHGLIERILNRYNNTNVEGAISNLFCLGLMFAGKSTNRQTKIMRKLFENKNGKISKMSLINIKTQNFQFDFSNLEFHECTIRGYTFFFNCVFNEKTKFKSSCVFNDLKSIIVKNKKDKKTSASLENFESGIKGDKSHLNVLEQNNNNFDFQRVELKDSIVILYEILLQEEKKTKKNLINVREKFRNRNKSDIDFQNLFNKFEKTKIVVKVDERNFYLNNDVKKQMSYFIKDGFPYPDSVAVILNEIKS